VAKKYDPLAIVQARAKDIASFAEKCQRKRSKYKDPVNQFTDLCGGRIIVHTAEQVKAVSAFIKEHFEIDQENSIDVSQRLKPTEFGYRSVHYIVSFKEGVFPTRDVNVEIPSIMFDEENFFWHPGDWSEDIAEALARECGLACLSEAHWKIIRFLRDFYFQNGRAPLNRQLAAGTDMSMLDIEALFPGGIKRGARRLAGLPNPKACL